MWVGRQQMAAVAAMTDEEKSQLEPKASPWSSTGYVNIIKVKNKF